jgi:hypothetical protein
MSADPDETRALSQWRPKARTGARERAIVRGSSSFLGQRPSNDQGPIHKQLQIANCSFNLTDRFHGNVQNPWRRPTHSRVSMETTNVIETASCKLQFAITIARPL